MIAVDESRYPGNKVVLIKSAFADGTTVTGAGVLVESTGVPPPPYNDEVLTAADLVWKPGVGAATSVTVDPKINGANFYGEIAADHYRYFPIASHGAAGDQFDFAVLHLATPFADPQPPPQFPSVGPAILSSSINAAGSGRGGIIGYPGGGTTMDDFIVAIVTTPGTSTAHYIETPAPTDPGYVGASVFYSVRAGVGQSLPNGVETADGQVAELTPQLIRLMNSWIDADHSVAAAQPSGAIAIPLPLTTTISPDVGAPGIDASEARLVDKASYLLNRPDVAAAGVDPAVHFATYGWHEATPPDALFDVKYYLQHNPDVAAAGVDPLLHYALYGWHEGRDPSAGFSTSAYLATHQDVALAGINPLEHYLWFGIAENRAVAPGLA